MEALINFVGLGLAVMFGVMMGLLLTINIMISKSMVKKLSQRSMEVTSELLKDFEME